MTREDVKSSNLKSVGYDKEKKVLEVEFHSGAVHQYSGVPANLHQRMMKASSIGGFFHTHIRNFFDSKPV